MNSFVLHLQGVSGPKICFLLSCEHWLLTQSTWVLFETWTANLQRDTSVIRQRSTSSFSCFSNNCSWVKNKMQWGGLMKHRWFKKKCVVTQIEAGLLAYYLLLQWVERGACGCDSSTNNERLQRAFGAARLAVNLSSFILLFSIYLLSFWAEAASNELCWVENGVLETIAFAPWSKHELPFISCLRQAALN